MVSYQTIKRLSDLVISLTILMALFPLLFAIAMILWLDGGQPIFRQFRLGRNQVPFQIYKFRTMVINADNLLSVDGKPTANRVTKLGAILRKLSIDELPQLLNIVKGEMSFIGPRPVLAEWKEKFSPDQRKRFAVLPGITGLAQVSGRNTIKWSKRVELDIQYVKNISFKNDFVIILKTFKVYLMSSSVVLDRNGGDVDDL